MDQREWCAIVHVDVSPRAVVDEGEQLLRDLVADVGSLEGTIELAALREPTRTNHFELVGRYRSEAAYLEHQTSPANLSFRDGLSTKLGAPYEDRLHSPKGNQIWPSAAVGDAVMVTQLEVRPSELDAALSVIDELASCQGADSELSGQVVLQRQYRPNNLEVISVWSSIEAFDEHLGTAPAQSVRARLAPLLIARPSDRRHLVLAGVWSQP